jgi:tRNA threonylcarbamoyladenosine biosynthesis protein TsaE
MEPMPRTSMDIELADSGATETLGVALAQGFRSMAPARPGAVVYLEGDLGAGKTTCVRSLLRTLGVTGLVRSPTYTLVETYPLAAITCVHIDLYRLRAVTEVDELGLRDLVGPGFLLLVEWPERGGTALPAADLALLLSYAGNGRRAGIRARTPVGMDWLEHLGRDTRLVPYVSNLT